MPCAVSIKSVITDVDSVLIVELYTGKLKYRVEQPTSPRPMSQQPELYATAVAVAVPAVEAVLATAPATNAADVSSDRGYGVDEGAAAEFLRTHAWPPGLSKALVKCLKKNPYRFFIIDDSGSMQSGDGNIVVRGRNIPCSRWMELTESLKFHVALARHARCPTEFRPLNSCLPIMIGCGSDDTENANQNRLMELFDAGPSGGTPLCQHINEVCSIVRRLEHSLKSSGQRASLIICTDGEASDGDVAQALRPLQALPIDVVIRLCTDADDVMTYWNNVEKNLELKLDILDDWKGEALEIRKSNPFVNYALCLHRFRESGVTLKEFDLLDEGQLSWEHSRNLLSVLFDKQMPSPQLDPTAFFSTVRHENDREPKVYDVLLRRQAPLVNMTELRRAYGPKNGCAVM